MAKKKHAQEDAAEKTEMKNQETEQAAERDEVLKTAEEKAGKAAEEAEKWKNDYLRLMAEFDTFRRRSAEESPSPSWRNRRTAKRPRKAHN